MARITLKPRDEAVVRWKKVAEHECLDLHAWIERELEAAYKRWLMMR